MATLSLQIGSLVAEMQRMKEKETVKLMYLKSHPNSGLFFSPNISETYGPEKMIKFCDLFERNIKVQHSYTP